MVPELQSKDINSFDLDLLTRQIISSSQIPLTAVQLTRFLCGISSPLFTTLKAGRMDSFGILENYRYSEVFEHVSS
jgi:ATP-dependent DNA helicase RecQ